MPFSSYTRLYVCYPFRNKCIKLHHAVYTGYPASHHSLISKRGVTTLRHASPPPPLPVAILTPTSHHLYSQPHMATKRSNITISTRDDGAPRPDASGSIMDIIVSLPRSAALALAALVLAAYAALVAAGTFVANALALVAGGDSSQESGSRHSAEADANAAVTTFITAQAKATRYAPHTHTHTSTTTLLHPLIMHPLLTLFVFGPPPALLTALVASPGACPTALAASTP